MATAADIARITRRSEALKSLSLGEAPIVDPTPFARFPEMQRAIVQFNDRQKLAWDRLKNMAAEAFLAGRDVPP